MAVLTPITQDDALQVAAAYGLGNACAFEGVPAGSVNSNFALEANGRRLFLRLYEERDVAGADREARLLEQISIAGVPTPAPLRRLDGGLVSVIRGKPAALFPWREGSMRCQAAVTPRHAWRVGEALARLHVLAAGQPSEAGRFGFEDLLRRVDAIAASCDERLAAFAPALREMLECAHAARDRGLPGGLTHGDLFRDNVLWGSDEHVAALLDFESACAGTYAYDLMVTLLAWCVGDDLDVTLARAMREGYETVRPLTGADRRGLLAEGKFAALRFTITRITDYELRIGAAGPRVVKDWRRFLMRFRRLQALGSEGLRRAIDA